MRNVFAALVILFMLAVVVQFLLAASGALDTAPKDKSFQPQRALGYGIPRFAVLQTLVSALARMPGRLIGMTGLVAGLKFLKGAIRAVAALSSCIRLSRDPHPCESATIYDVVRDQERCAYADLRTHRHPLSDATATSTERRSNRTPPVKR